MTKSIEAVLKSFIRHVVNLQHEDDPAGTGFTREFRILREKQVEDRNNERFSMMEGKKEENIRKNRYKDILPRDDRRVVLKEIPGEPGSDYINASFIDDVNGHRGYIAAQGPMPHTINDFWRMLWQYRAEIVFMACRMKEDSKAKCEKYWAEEGESMVFGEIKVYTESKEEIQDHFIKRQLRAEKKGKIHRLVQFHYVGWPDHNVPSSPDALRRMIEDVRNYRKHPQIPMVVHCSAGCGRTGTICAIDFAWTLLDRGLVSEGFSMFEVIRSLREQRISMVQTPDQYEYTHMVMKSLCNEWLVSFAKNDYENVSVGDAKPVELVKPEESYYNVDFHPEQSNARDSTSSSGKRSSTESSTSIPSPRPAPLGKKPDLKPHRPEITRPKPETPAQQKPDIGRPKPTVRANVAKLTTPVNAVYASPLPRSKDNHHHAAVRRTSSTGSPRTPPVQDKNVLASRDQFGLFAQERSEVSKAGGVAVSSASRQKMQGAEMAAPPPPQRGRRLQGVEGRQQQQQQQQQQQRQSGSEEGASGLERNRMKNVKDKDYANDIGDSKEPVPALPLRQYKPEEIASAATSKPSAASSGSHHRHQYNNAQPSSPSPAVSSPRGNVHWPQQPIPINPPSPSSRSNPLQLSRGPQMISPRPARRQGQAVADSSPSAQDGGQPHSVTTSSSNFVLPRPGWMESSPSHSPTPKRDFPGAFTGAHTIPSGAPQPTQSADAPKPIVAAPGFNHGAEARSATTNYVLERIPRVRGPRPHPTGWAAFSKNQRGHYL